MSLLSKNIKNFFWSLFKLKNESQNSIIEISQDIILNVMDKLSNFENKQGFLKPISLHSLAKKLQTNPKYLSKIINTHYEKNFSSYINDLRIQYLLKELKTDDSLKKYTIKTLAKKIGFRSTEAFSKTFKKHTGFNPSTYLNTIKHK
ncbi:helix-turn-helix transcriptional regulator [Kordia sp. YSTF-M3]|uniref:Helix-turn-helix transcriptional regulator n=1 Tax=Kordia aestuariivivens TaxID=2759037 RepID=A0ABR7QA50_9FLAO|nr:helix-turn-helix transcriptional regulator [Kordia aestuariivivens]MBC8755444.1 helix-turn-helix transcriptional regulator [Kordia aestuariivivens]